MPPTVDAADNHVASITPVSVEQSVVVPGTSVEELTEETVCALTVGVCTVSMECPDNTGHCVFTPDPDGCAQGSYA